MKGGGKKHHCTQGCCWSPMRLKYLVNVFLTFRAARQHDSREAAPAVRHGLHTFLWQYLVSSLFGSMN